MALLGRRGRASPLCHTQQHQERKQVILKQKKPDPLRRSNSCLTFNWLDKGQATLIKLEQKSMYQGEHIRYWLIYLWNWQFLQECTRQVVSVLSRPRVGLYAVLSTWLEVPIRQLIEVRLFHLLASTSKLLKSSFRPLGHFLNETDLKVNAST